MKEDGKVWLRNYTNLISQEKYCNKRGHHACDLETNTGINIYWVSKGSDIAIAGKQEIATNKIKPRNNDDVVILIPGFTK